VGPDTDRRPRRSLVSSNAGSKSRGRTLPFDLFCDAICMSYLRKGFGKAPDNAKSGRGDEKSFPQQTAARLAAWRTVSGWK
jgi:hypothetical protein